MYPCVKVTINMSIINWLYFRIQRSADLLVLNDKCQELRSKEHSTEMFSKPSPCIHLPPDIGFYHFSVPAIRTVCTVLNPLNFTKQHITTHRVEFCQSHSSVAQGLLNVTLLLRSEHYSI